jgi:hypothetical protein
MKEVRYNVWMEEYGRWTNAPFRFFSDPFNKQDPKNPVPLTKEQAIRWADEIGFGEVRPLIGKFKKRKPKKVIPNTPLDPSLPILMAGHIQDRQRKR